MFTEKKDKIFDTKNRIAYPQILNNEIKLISFNTDDSTLIGSASYKVQKYPADIDLYEQVKTCCSEEDAIEYFYLGIQSISRKIELSPNHWLIELKCGIDKRYEFTIGIEDLTNFVTINRNLFSEMDYYILIELDIQLKNTKKNHELIYEQIDDIMRKYKIIRWSAAQIQLGYQIRYGKKFYLKECINTISPINIEIIAVINNKFTDVSNFYVVMFKDKLTGKDIVINFPQSYLYEGKNFVLKGLKEGIHKVYNSKLHKDVFKAVKRIYSYARITKNDHLYNKIKPILSGDLAELSQLKSELGTLHEILTFTDNLPFNIVYSQLDSIKWRAGGNTYLNDLQIDSISKRINLILANKRSIEFMISSIEYLKQYILDIVNYHADQFMKNNNILYYFDNISK